MKAMTLTRCGLGHVDSVEADKPTPGPTEVLVKVLACGVCRTDLHVLDGELPNPTIPVVRVMRSWAESSRSGAR
jgi:propanol-preferring alcohol dehydrogenase